MSEFNQRAIKKLHMDIASQYGVIGSKWASDEEKEAARQKRDELLREIERIKAAEAG